MNKRVISRKLLAFFDLLPVALPAAVAAFGSVAVCLLLLGQFHTALVWALGLAAVAVVWIPIAKYHGTIKRPGSKVERNVANCLVIIGVLGWVGFNVFYTAQHVFTNRDPGTYAVAGAWLTKKDNLKLTAEEPFGKVEGVHSFSGGFSPVPGEQNRLAAQGAHMLPAFIGTAGRIIGEERMLRINILFGAVALLSVFGFARLLVKPRWALVSTGALALAAPMLYFSRDTYTEPLALAFVFGSLSLLWIAQAGKKPVLWLLAGLVAGAGTLARIDAYITIAGLCVFLAVFLMYSRPQDRKREAGCALLLLAGMATTSLIGYLDVYLLSPSYYLSEWKNIKPELLFIIAILVTGSVGILIAWKTRILHYADTLTKPWRVPAALGTMLFVALILASRPLWQEGYWIPPGATMPLRNYSEQTVNWLVWYLGPVMTLLGATGFALATKRTLEGKGKLLLPALIIVGGTALLYIVKPSIFPDQIWASRRFLPVIFPGVAVFGALALQSLYARTRIKYWKIPGQTIATILATLAFAGPLLVSYPFFIFLRETTWYAPLKTVCQTLPQNAAVLWIGSARTQLIEPTKAFCARPSEGYGKIFSSGDAPSTEVLAQAAQNARAAGYKPVIGVFGREKVLLDRSGSQLAAVTYFSYGQTEQTNTRPPSTARIISESILMGEIRPDGTIKPL